MPKTRCSLLPWLPMLALLVGLCCRGQVSFAQALDEASRNSAVQAQGHSQPIQPAKTDAHDSDDHDSARNSGITFQGRIVKSGSKLVLAGTDDTTYQLDDQQKAHNFLNQQVKVTGVLDATTGTIRINAIDPA
jgi:hypothetical protein